MKKLYFQCDMGVAGDMLCGALLDLLDSGEQQTVLNVLGNIGFDGVSVSAQRQVKCMISGTKFYVEIRKDEQYHNHTHIRRIYEKIDSVNIDDKT